MELFPQVAGFSGKLKILPNIWNEGFCKNSQKLKFVHYFWKISILNVWQGSEYAFELAFICFYKNRNMLDFQIGISVPLRMFNF